eukprot:NODE_17206_length_956_cov_3.019300.p1 GENE.NODE_17206_length_956_cov_3.019300~~NODE_17206_length_956_cov_3.019300.p1  ORF type:complete len:265 (-),score=72.63 NODE_17206_length_956_cov_3.019300:162-875(-)
MTFASYFLADGPAILPCVPQALRCAGGCRLRWWVQFSLLVIVCIWAAPLTKYIISGHVTEVEGRFGPDGDEQNSWGHFSQGLAALLLLAPLPIPACKSLLGRFRCVGPCTSLVKFLLTAVLICLYPVYNLHKRLEHWAYCFWRTTYFVGLSDLGFGALMGTSVTLVLLPVTKALLLRYCPEVLQSFWWGSYEDAQSKCTNVVLQVIIIHSIILLLVVNTIAACASYASVMDGNEPCH